MKKVDKCKIETYILEHLGEERDLLHEVYRYTNLHALYPGMVSGHEQGRLLSMISHMIRPTEILEIGTFTGYSAICLSEGLVPGGHLHTIEQNDEVTEVAQSFFESANLSECITLHTGNALDIIPDLNIIFDLVFIDAAKDMYLDYYCMVFEKVKPGGYIIIDNILWYGKVADPEVRDKTTDKLREFNDFVSKDARVEKAIIQNRDGLFILRKKNEQFAK